MYGRSMSWTSHSTRGGGHRGSCSTRIGEAEARERCKVGRGFPRKGRNLFDLYLDVTQKCDRNGIFLEIFWKSVFWWFFGHRSVGPFHFIESEVVPCSQMCSAKLQEFVLIIKVTQILEEKKQALAAKQKTREAQPEPDVLVGMCPTAQVINLFLLGNLVSFFDPDSLHKSNKRNLESSVQDLCHLASNLNRKNVLSWRRGLRPTRRTAWYHTTLCTCSVHVGSEVMASLFIIPHEVFHSSHGCKAEKRLCWWFGVFLLLLLGNFGGMDREIRQNAKPTLPQEYADSAAELVKLRREAKVNGNFFVEPEARPGLNGWGIPPWPNGWNPPKLGWLFGSMFFSFLKGENSFPEKNARRSCCLWCELRASSRWAPNPGPFWPLEQE